MVKYSTERLERINGLSTIKVVAKDHSAQLKEPLQKLSTFDTNCRVFPAYHHTYICINADAAILDHTRLSRRILHAPFRQSPAGRTRECSRKEARRLERKLGRLDLLIVE